MCIIEWVWYTHSVAPVPFSSSPGAVPEINNALSPLLPASCCAFRFLEIDSLCLFSIQLNQSFTLRQRHDSSPFVGALAFPTICLGSLLWGVVFFQSSGSGHELQGQEVGFA
jgi:hypothetical protein